ncbi:MAG: SDR family oxidoreductase [Planctomycetes bacterium]|nr:SDR family oxidoreductase [Planctomycetota bacterium]
MARLQGKTALITGAAGGIGRAIAEVFAIEEGAHVYLADRDEQSGLKAEAELTAAGAAAKFVRCDVSSAVEVNAAVQQMIGAKGRVDILVNNAGVNFSKPFDELTTEDWDRVLGVDLRGVFLCTRACIGHFLRQQAGSVINIASVHTLAAMPGAAPYDAAKCGVVGMTKSLAVEYAARKVRFNCISPGLIDTQIWRDIVTASEDSSECEAHWWANIPMGRVGLAREIGLLAAFLASDDAAYLTGANIPIDGGMTSQLISKESYRSRSVEGR